MRKAFFIGIFKYLIVIAYYLTGCINYGIIFIEREKENSLEKTALYYTLFSIAFKNPEKKESPRRNKAWGR